MSAIGANYSKEASVIQLNGGYNHFHSGWVRIQISWVLAVNWPIFNLISHSLQYQHTGCSVKILYQRRYSVLVAVRCCLRPDCRRAEQDSSCGNKRKKNEEPSLSMTRRKSGPCEPPTTTGLQLHICRRRVKTPICNHRVLHMNPGPVKQFESPRCILGAVRRDGPEVVYHRSAGESLREFHTPPSAALKIAVSLIERKHFEVTEVGLGHIENNFLTV